MKKVTAPIYVQVPKGSTALELLSYVNDPNDFGKKSISNLQIDDNTDEKTVLSVTLKIIFSQYDKIKLRFVTCDFVEIFNKLKYEPEKICYEYKTNKLFFSPWYLTGGPTTQEPLEAIDPALIRRYEYRNIFHEPLQSEKITGRFINLNSDNVEKKKSDYIFNLRNIRNI